MNETTGSKGGTFNLGHYVDDQPARTQEIERKMPLMVRMTKDFNEGSERSQHAHERTVKSYILQEMEAFSREAKIRWCTLNSARPINLQHDGMVIQLADNCSPARAAKEMGQACSKAVALYHLELTPHPARQNDRYRTL
jgi:hypothetical protein